LQENVTGADRFFPEASLTQGSDGTLYGTAGGGGSGCGIQNCEGTIFQMAPDGSFTILHTFFYRMGPIPCPP